MKKSGDYYVTVVEDVTLGQIVATATLIIEHKFIHSCAKVCAHMLTLMPMNKEQVFSHEAHLETSLAVNVLLFTAPWQRTPFKPLTLTDVPAGRWQEIKMLATKASPSPSTGVSMVDGEH